MVTLFNKLHARLGDLWWYSLMIFVACRTGDVIQAFIGLWLVPKYVGHKELGAVLPLQQLSGFFAVPLAIIATVFAKYVNAYATKREYGKVKSLIHDTLLTACIVFIVSIAVAYLIIPHFYVRLNVASGMLTVLILAAGFTANISNLLASALQGLKKFRTMTVQNLISAPIRLVTLLAAMPVRALSGYILGQATPPAACSVFAALTLHHDFKLITADKSWRKDLPEIIRYLFPVAVYMGLGMLFATISATIYRQRLPAVESAAYYLLSRFSEIAGYFGTSMMVILLPLASEAHENGKDNPSLLSHTVTGTVLTTLLLSAGFAFFGKHILSLSEVWQRYANYAYILPWMTAITGSSLLISSIVTYEMACRRFRMAAFVIFINLAWTIFIVAFTGYGYFRGILPDAIVDWMGSIHLARLSTMTWATVAVHCLQLSLLPLVLSSTHTRHE